MSSYAAQVRVPIGGLFLKVVIELETCQIYKSVLQIINSVARTPSRTSEKVSCKYTINKVILDVGLLLSGGPELV
jgi:hypothetical protein